jgi:hypothetical protein
MYFVVFGTFNNHFVYFMVIWYISPCFGMRYQDKSGNLGEPTQVFRDIGVLGRRGRDSSDRPAFFDPLAATSCSGYDRVISGSGCLPELGRLPPRQHPATGFVFGECFL